MWSPAQRLNVIHTFSECLPKGVQILVYWPVSPSPFLSQTWSLPSNLVTQCSLGPVITQFHNLQNLARHRAIFEIKAHHAQTYSQCQTFDLPFVLSSLPSRDHGPDGTLHWCYVLLLPQNNQSSHFQIWKQGFRTEGATPCKGTDFSRHFKDLDICYHNWSCFKLMLCWLNYKYFSSGFTHVLKTLSTYPNTGSLSIEYFR